jgi:hypothetical protein
MSSLILMQHHDPWGWRGRVLVVFVTWPVASNRKGHARMPVHAYCSACAVNLAHHRPVSSCCRRSKARNDVAAEPAAGGSKGARRARRGEQGSAPCGNQISRRTDRTGTFEPRTTRRPPTSLPLSSSVTVKTAGITGTSPPRRRRPNRAPATRTCCVRPRG